MIFFFISVLAGLFTVLAPCILPLLPIVIGASETNERYVSKRALVVIGSLSLSVILFTLLLKASTVLIDIPQSFWTTFSGTIIVLVGLFIVFPSLWTRIPVVQKLSVLGNKSVGVGYKKKSHTGDMLIGLSLGPVFTTCSPTYLFIIATVLPASFTIGLIYLLGFTLGLALSLLGIAYFGQRLVNGVSEHLETTSIVKQILGILIVIAGLLVLTGYDKKLEARLLDSGYGATIQLEDGLLQKFAPTTKMETKSNKEYQTITVSGGCFWCTESYLQETPGIMDVVSGYVGGDEGDATYSKVLSGTTKHREGVQVIYDPSVISTEKVLDVFWSHIDPTDSSGQFADKGYQYTTAIFYHTPEQKEIAVDSKNRLEKSGKIHGASTVNNPANTDIKKNIIY